MTDHVTPARHATDRVVGRQLYLTPVGYATCWLVGKLDKVCVVQ